MAINKILPVKCRHLLPILSQLMLRKMQEYALAIFMKSKKLEQLAAGDIYMRTRLYMALLLLGFLLLTACGGDGGNANEAGTTSCTLGSSALDSCTLN